MRSERLQMLVEMPVHIARRGFYDLNRSKFDETSCTFVSSRGIAKVCHPLVNLNRTYSRRMESSYLAGIASGSAVYVHTANIPEFVGTYLPQIRVPITLVTGADDLSVSPGAFG